jgi:1-acyl-sn-glycerol-3-phosphate acyltransferase
MIQPVEGASGRGSMKLSYYLGWSLFRFVFAVYCRRRAFSAEHVPTTGSVILACNHASFLDPFLVGASLHRPVNYLARQTLFRFPGLGALLRSWNTVPVDRDGGSGAGLKAILDRLRAGGAILLFPEGTRSRDGQLQPARAGIGMTVIKSTAPVVPVRVFGTFEAYGRHSRLPRPRRVMVKFGLPMDFQAQRVESQNCVKPRLRELYQQVADEIMLAIAELKPDEGLKSAIGQI